MSISDLVVAEAFLAALATAAKTGDRNSLYPLLARDVAWITPQRDIVGLDNVRSELTWLSPPDHLNVEFDNVDTRQVKGGVFVSRAREVYRFRTTVDPVYTRQRRIELTIRDGKVARYEMHRG